MNCKKLLLEVLEMEKTYLVLGKNKNLKVEEEMNRVKKLFGTKPFFTRVGRNETTNIYTSINGFIVETIIKDSNIGRTLYKKITAEACKELIADFKKERKNSDLSHTELVMRLVRNNIKKR